ncbi:MAG: insulinase family protein [Candidatus Aminicenantes bacterium]|nr:insulinase family protein [Candidatus Aminicenantes bacterium]
MKKAVKEAFSEWTRGSEPVVVPVEPESKKSVYLVDRPGSQQSTLYIGLPVIDPSHKDWIPLQVMDALLGGAFTSRITSNIREDKGYTYSPYSQVSSRYRDAYWLQFASVGNAVTAPAVKEILYEIDRLREEAPTAEELKGVQNYLAGVFVLQNSTRSGIAGILGFKDFQGLDESYLTSYVQNVHALTPEDIRKMARTYLIPENLTIVIVGDASQIKDSLKVFGEIFE